MINFPILHNQNCGTDSRAFVCISVMNRSLQQGKIFVETGQLLWYSIPANELISGCVKTMLCERYLLLCRRCLSIGGEMRTLRGIIMKPFLNVFR